MTTPSAQSMAYVSSRADTPVGGFVFFSLVFHALVFVVLPLLSSVLFKPRTYERPQVFHLVRAPAPQKVRHTKTPSHKPMEERRIDRPTARKEVPAEQRENLDELSDLLQDIPVPSSEIDAIPGFTAHWYLNSVRQKIERYWKPNVENPKLMVIVEFTIFAGGNISEPGVRESSGDGVLDNLALRAVALAAPFGKIPSSYSGNKLDIRLTLHATRR
jgi:TonB family protein